MLSMGPQLVSMIPSSAARPFLTVEQRAGLPGQRPGPVPVAAESIYGFSEIPACSAWAPAAPGRQRGRRSRPGGAGRGGLGRSRGGGGGRPGRFIGRVVGAGDLDRRRVPSPPARARAVAPVAASRRGRRQSVSRARPAPGVGQCTGVRRWRQECSGRGGESDGTPRYGTPVKVFTPTLAVRRMSNIVRHKNLSN